MICTPIVGQQGGAYFYVIMKMVVRRIGVCQYRRRKLMNYTKMNRKQIGSNIWRLVSNSEMTLEEIAEELHLSSARVIYDWMSGKKLPSLERAYNLAKLFNTTIEVVFFS